jgi:hypothetical protein
MRISLKSPAFREKLKKFGLLAFLFFFLKGLAWLALLWWAGSKVVE